MPTSPDTESLLIEAIVNCVADWPTGVSSGFVANRLSLSQKTTRRVLLDMEKHGCVVRAGDRRGTLWYLG